METVEVVIRIPKVIYDDLSNKEMLDEFVKSEVHFYDFEIGKAIQAGIVLPKGHGRLIETDELISHLKAHEDLLVRHYADEDGNIPFEIDSRIDQIRICMNDIANAPIIIEADKTESEV